MALTHPHLHHPHTRSENVVLWAAAAIVVALTAFVAFQVTDNGTQSIAPAQTQTHRIPEATARADTLAPAADADVSDLVRRGESPAPTTRAETPAQANPAAASAVGQAPVTVQAENSYMGLEN